MCISYQPDPRLASTRYSIFVLPTAGMELINSLEVAPDAYNEVFDLRRGLGLPLAKAAENTMWSISSMPRVSPVWRSRPVLQGFAEDFPRVDDC